MSMTEFELERETRNVLETLHRHGCLQVTGKEARETMAELFFAQDRRFRALEAANQEPQAIDEPKHDPRGEREFSDVLKRLAVLEERMDRMLCKSTHTRLLAVATRVARIEAWADKMSECVEGHFDRPEPPRVHPFEARSVSANCRQERM